MKISEHIKHSLDASEARDLEKSMLFVCLAIDGTASKMYPDIGHVGTRFKKFISQHIDVIQLMFGGVDLKNTVFPLKNSKSKLGMKFEEVVYEKFRCNLAHGNELPDGYTVNAKLETGVYEFLVDIKNQSITLPESTIFALGLPCILATVNVNQIIGNKLYHYHDSINKFVIDRWWGKLECARQIMDFENQILVKLDFSKASE